MVEITKEELKEYNRLKKARDKQKTYVSNWIQKNPKYRILLVAKMRAKKENIAFNLDESDIAIPESCPYLGIKLTFIHGHGRVQSNLSLDRIDSKKGYVKGNVQIISDLANRMKQDASIEQLVSFAHGVLKTHAKIWVATKVE